VVTFFLLLAVFTVVAEAALIYRSGTSFARLHDKPCAIDEVLKILPENLRSSFLMGDAWYGGKAYAMCWTLMPDGNVLMLYPDGEMGLLPASSFKRATDA
jgi:hypothetical protein